MKGTITDFLKLAAEKPALAKELGALAERFGFEFSDEVSDAELEAVAGGSDAPTPEEWREMQAKAQEAYAKQRDESPAVQTLSAMMKAQHETLKAIMSNMR